MRMPGDIGGIVLHYLDEGDPGGAPLLFLHALGTDLHLWDAVLPLLPPGLRVIRVDLRGHGRSPCPAGEYYMGDLVGDVAALLDRLKVREAMVVGVSLGGMIAQGLAAERLDQVRALVLSNTATKIGTSQIWRDRMEQLRAGGMAALGAATLARWFPRRFHDDPAFAATRARLLSTPVEGYLGCCAAIAETDLYESTARLRLPTLAIAGSEDGSTPPDMVRETAGLIPGSRFCLIRGAGHLPCVDRPRDFAAALTTFLTETGHV
ncbi:3-oxoadipate enol-lactonase [Actibacterium sp. MT2.3-13A]|uniref:3-oxoadipate enol-lactonase n=1 Tax=Actibacterium sp. MT2.3-13A TaxID=2828332 RepID=UPI001BA71AB6|nr:3-oxoadipate enol-lactonase [Actibacterium sp. MT2.3-13A]